MKKSRKNNVFIVLLLCCKAEKRVWTTLEVRLGYGVREQPSLIIIYGMTEMYYSCNYVHVFFYIYYKYNVETFMYTKIDFYRTRVLAEYSITSYIYVTESVRTTAEVCVVMTEEVWVPQSLTDEAMDQNAPSKLEQTCISGLPWATSLKGEFTQKWKCCHQLLTMNCFLLWNTKAEIWRTAFVRTEEVNRVQKFHAPKSTSF